ncbi:MAG: hypothetical protein F6K19_39835 [Cyanothece sp. SIO1E1]|nr:hypothetical protein [Cyanothece sp. SIO1E1]
MSTSLSLFSQMTEDTEKRIQRLENQVKALAFHLAEGLRIMAHMRSIMEVSGDHPNDCEAEYMKIHTHIAAVKSLIQTR